MATCLLFNFNSVDEFINHKKYENLESNLCIFSFSLAPSFTRSFGATFPVFIGDFFNATGCQYETLFTKDIDFYESKDQRAMMIDTDQIESVWKKDHYLVTFALDSSSTIVTKELEGNYFCSVEFNYLNEMVLVESENAPLVISSTYEFMNYIL